MSDTYSTPAPMPVVNSTTPESIAIRRKMAMALMQQGLETTPIKHWTQGLARVLQAGMGGYQQYQAGQDEAEARQKAVEDFGKTINFPSSTTPTPTAPAPTPTATPERIYSPDEFNRLDAIAPPQKYAPLVIASAAKNNVDPNLLAAVLKRENNWQPTGTSPAGAQGIAQFMPGTAAEMGVNPNDPNSAIPGAAKYLSQQLDRFGQSPQLAAAAYNAGPGRVERAGGDISKLPAETQAYVSAVAGGRQTPSQNVAPPVSRATTDMGKLLASTANPFLPPAYQHVGAALAQQALTPTQYGFQTTPDGMIIRTDPKTGSVAPIYQAPTKNTFGKIGQNRDGQDIYGIINAEKGTATPVQVPGTASAPGAPDSGLTGDEFLKSMNDPGRADLIKGMVEGRMAPATMGRYGTQAVQSLLKDAARYEPGFDMTKWGARAATMKDFASGAAAKNVTSLNTVIGHLGDLADKADALGNSSFTPYNEYIKNPLANVTGSPEVKNFNLARNAVADEMAKVFRGGGLSDAETRQWKENISAAGSPAQLKGAVKTAIGLMESRLNAMGEQRNKGMSTSTEPRALLTEKSQATLDKVMKWANGDTPASATPAPIQRAHNPKTGEVIELRDGKWVPAQ